MIFLANRANLDKRTLLSRLHNRLQTQVSTEGSPVEQVWYHMSTGNKTGVRATIAAPIFLTRSYPVDEAELQISFDFPQDYAYDFYKVQWVEPERDLMIGWHQDETHMSLGECHLQIDHRGETVQREEAEFLDSHPLNVFEQRIDGLVSVLDELRWENDRPSIPEHAIR
ncbi:hypothetical protein [Haloglomus halophilum]|uniref:hypothetical protein n=1 Tax=Haloglomus halophilum TaxID=2962672 RepID=UPI0020C96034|nr:hypothetical protein [Haloglomus halophilum]